jgi:hypothetical protein
MQKEWKLRSKKKVLSANMKNMLNSEKKGKNGLSPLILEQSQNFLILCFI